MNKKMSETTDFLKTARRCSREGCRRLCYKHVGKTGAECKMEDIGEEELKRDDLEKHEMKKKEENDKNNAGPSKPYNDESSTDDEDEEEKKRKLATLQNH